MCLRFPKRSQAVIFSIWLFVGLAHSRDLRVCADPDNLPFSNTKQQGFENRIAEVVARDLHAHLIYQWHLLTTSPYYRSAFVFVTRRDHLLQVASLDDPALRHLKIGVEVLQEDYTPPGTALARRGLQNQIVGFDRTGEKGDSIIRAVANRRVDAAIVWGPLAGYFAQKFGNSLQLNLLSPELDPPGLPFTFSISMGVRKGNTALRDELEAVLRRRGSEIRGVLHRYGVPQLELAQTSGGEN
ncbi:MAG: quinoprotein dehydrogenase-associated putative ABC transporter substrate-binding protein [Acidobacteria bacterium]|nr:MAG: quinoprotein dehydrogenase-associated putative ABC transporter substrate-binding protein [Acidobacteriota bacterium]